MYTFESGFLKISYQFEIEQLNREMPVNIHVIYVVILLYITTREDTVAYIIGYLAIDHWRLDWTALFYTISVKGRVTAKHAMHPYEAGTQRAKTRDEIEERRCGI